MLLEFINNTGLTISLKNTDTNSASNLRDTNGALRFVSDPETVYRFECNRRYLTIKTEVNEGVVYAAMIPIPFSGMETIYAKIGINEDNTIVMTDKTLRGGDIIDLPDSHTNVLVIGLGNFTITTSGAVSSVTRPVYFSLKTISKENHVLVAELVRVDNIADFMGSKPALTTADIIQIVIVSLIIVVVVAGMLSIVVYEKVYNNKQDN